jgi:hypothetical protein
LASRLFLFKGNSGIILSLTEEFVPLPKPVCPHFNRESDNNQVCTKLGCGKRITAPVQLLARIRTPPVIRLMGRSRSRLREGGGFNRKIQ